MLLCLFKLLNTQVTSGKHYQKKKKSPKNKNIIKRTNIKVFFILR